MLLVAFFSKVLRLLEQVSMITIGVTMPQAKQAYRYQVRNEIALNEFSPILITPIKLREIYPYNEMDNVNFADHFGYLNRAAMYSNFYNSPQF